MGRRGGEESSVANRQYLEKGKLTPIVNSHLWDCMKCYFSSLQHLLAELKVKKYIINPMDKTDPSLAVHVLIGSWKC